MGQVSTCMQMCECTRTLRRGPSVHQRHQSFMFPVSLKLYDNPEREIYFPCFANKEIGTLAA